MVGKRRTCWKESLCPLSGTAWLGSHTTRRPVPKSDAEIQNAIANGFQELDNSLMIPPALYINSTEPMQDKIKKLAPCQSGSCALVSIFDADRRKLHVACTGGSRAVFGRKVDNSEWKTTALSTDQTGSNESEVERLQRAHPGETKMVQNGGLFGVRFTRSFGDSRWKWPLELQVDVTQGFTVGTASVDTDTPYFLIMASGGLWEIISSEQAVNIVAKWVDSRMAVTAENWVVVGHTPFHIGTAAEGMNDDDSINSRMTTQDENAAVHLICNALGGNHHDLVASRLAVESPYCRLFRDDITVQVIFFNTSILTE
ncbi:phosphatase 2C-like domain-containing protein [Nemania sp. NC0429]|nr:phosphatase 2C-like domain-containing protein [Nemania sp. NC0429]